MIYKVCLLLVVVGAALADPGGYKGSYPSLHYFDYHVSDQNKGVQYRQHEKSDGKNVYGSYVVILPDGRKQKVEYTADHYKGYVAKVSYYGKANHPKHYNPPAIFQRGYGH